MTGDAAQASVDNEDTTDETVVDTTSGEIAAGEAATGEAAADEPSTDGGTGDAGPEVKADEAKADENDGADDERDDDDRLVEEGEIAGDYLEQLLDVLDYDGDIDLDVDGDRAIVSIDGGKDLDKLVGRDGEVLDALQELTRLAVQQSTGDRSRLMLDVSRWRADRRERLAGLGTEVAERVRDGGDRESLDPMTPFERKIVHDAVAAVDGVRSESEGAEPKRRVVVLKE